MMEWLEGVGNFLKYTVSLPERTVRALAAGVGGMSKILTDLVLPDSLRGTTTYKVLVGNMQRLVIERVGAVDNVYSKTGEQLPQDMVQRKLAGNAVEALGLMSFHFSPIWLFAVGADVVSGSKAYMDRLTIELNKEGVIDPNSKTTEFGDVLGAVEQATSQSAKVLDLPPLSQSDFKKYRQELTSSYASMFSKSTNLIPSFDSLWKRMTSIAIKEHLSLEAVAGLMTVNAARAAGASLAATNAAGGLFMDKVLASYGASLDAMEKEGYAAFFSRTMAPYGEAIRNAFNPDRETYTEWLVTFKMFRKTEGPK
jgi:hypothetical protein